MDYGKIGEVVHIDHSEVSKPNFFRTDSDGGLGVETFIEPGDLLCLDEVWRFWPKRGKIADRHMNFFRMHGHLVHPVSGLICEVALISQSIRDINENIRDVVAETYRMTKDTAVGSDKSFSVQVFSRGSEMVRDEIRSFKGIYNPEFFKFYKSHSQAVAGSLPKEDSVDKRGNILRGPLFRIVIPVMLLVGTWGAWRTIQFFNGRGKPEAATAVAAPGAVPSGAAASSPSPPRPPVPSVSPWRLVGWVNRDADSYVLLEKDGVYRRDYDVDKYQFKGKDGSAMLDGATVATWSGSKASAGFLK